MSSTFDQLLEQLEAAEGDTGNLTLVTFDFAVADDPLLREVAVALSITHWFDAKTIQTLVPNHADHADHLLERLKSLPMVESFDRGKGQVGWNIHEATRLPLRQRLWQTDPEQFKAYSRLAAKQYMDVDSDDADFVVTAERLYHQYASDSSEEMDAFIRTVRSWAIGSRFDALSTAARLVQEVLSLIPASTLSLRKQAWTNLTRAYLSDFSEAKPQTLEYLSKAEREFRSLHSPNLDEYTASLDLVAVLSSLGDLSVSQGDLAKAVRFYSEAREFEKPLESREPANAEWQNDLYVLIIKLGNLMWALGKVAEAEHCFNESKNIAERLLNREPGNSNWKFALAISFVRLAVIEVELGRFDKALAYLRVELPIWKEIKDNYSRWHRNISFLFRKLGKQTKLDDCDLVGALKNCKEQLISSTGSPVNDIQNLAIRGEQSRLLEQIGDEAKAGEMVGARNCYALCISIEKSLPDKNSFRISQLETKLLAASGQLIHKLKAKDTTGRWAYYFVLVEEEREHGFLRAIGGDGTIDLEDYGKVIASCYGEAPTQEVQNYLKDRYGFTV